MELSWSMSFAEADSGFGGVEEVRPPPIFWNHLVFLNHFETLQIMLFEVELITNNAH